MAFPVSSGQHHRANECEWVPVEPPKPAKKDKEVSEHTSSETSTTSKHKTTTTAAATASKSVDNVPLPTTGNSINLNDFQAVRLCGCHQFSYISSLDIDYGYQTSIFSQPVEPQPTFVPPAPVPPPTPAALEPAPAPVQQVPDNIFEGVVISKDLDVTSIITKRLNAMRKLQDNPMDSEAIKQMYRTQKDVRMIITK